MLTWLSTCLLTPRHLSHVLALQTPVSVKSITDYHNFVPPDKAICIGNIQSKVGQLALPVLCGLQACFSQSCNHAALGAERRGERLAICVTVVCTGAC